MLTISFENGVGVFKINDLYAITEMLNKYLNQPQKAKELFPNLLKIKIDQNIWKLIIMDLVKQKRAIRVFCPECDLEFYPDQIKIEKLGTYADPTAEENFWKRMKGLFERKKLEMKIGRIGRFGGEKLICKKCKSDLLSVVRWIS